MGKFMGKLRLDARGAAVPYLMFFIIVILGALVWIVFNEFLLHVADWVSTGTTQDPSFTWPILLTLYRATPVVILISAFVWAVVQSHKSSEVGF